MVESTIARFRENFKEAMLANIHKSYGSLEEFADDKNYDLEELKSMLEGQVHNLDSFLKLLLDTNWSVSFKDHFDHNFNFPDSFSLQSNLQKINNFT